MWMQKLNRWSTAAFMLAGGLIVVALLLIVLVEMGGQGNRAFLSDMSSPVGIALGVLAIVMFTLGAMAIIIGLLGLYPRLEERTPRLALAGVVFTMVAGAAALVIPVVFGIGPLIVGAVFGGESSGVLYHLHRFVFHLFYLGFPLGLLFFGAALWKTGTVSRLAAGLMVVTGLLLFMVFIYELRIWLFGAPRVSFTVGFLGYGLLPITALVVGYSLRTRPQHTGRKERDKTVEAEATS